jgi:outer membrane protein OmpA-like peptidoglycan-associated protein
MKEEQKMTNKIHSVIKIGFGLFIPIFMIFAGCGPSQQEMMARDHLANAKAAYAQARANPNVAINAQIPLMDAGRAVDAAEQAREYDEMDHLAYLSERKTRIAVATAEEQMAENDKKALSRETERVVIQGREQEQRSRMEARESNAAAREWNTTAWTRTQEAQIAKMEARESNAAARESNAEAWSQTRKAEKATDRADKLQQEIAALKGRMTDRGIVLTIGDVLFATGTATLSPMADNEINRLAAFMKEYPDRSVLIEGYTDSTGTEGTNLDLSLNRANAVSNKLVAKGISKSRIATKGFGEESPVAGNDTAAGREQNRRVDVIILNEGVNP